MGRPKKFRHRKNVSVIFEREEHHVLRLLAAERSQSLSAFIRALALNALRGKSARQKPKDETGSES